MKLSKEARAALEAIRPKVEKQDSRWRDVADLNNLETVHIELMKIATNRTVTLDRTCSSCIMRAVGQAYNYITYHEQNVEPRQEPAKVVSATTGDPIEGENAPRLKDGESVTFANHKYDQRVAELAKIGMLLNEGKTGFDADGSGAFVSVESVAEMTDQEFVDLLQDLRAEVDLSAGESQSAQSLERHANESPEKTAARIIQLQELGFIFGQHEDIQGYILQRDVQPLFISEISVRRVTDDQFLALVQDALSKETVNATTFRDGELVDVKVPANLPAGISIEGNTSTKTESPAEPVALAWDADAKIIVEVDADKNTTPFTGDIEKLNFNKVLWPLARQKGWVGGKPSKDKLVEFLTDGK